MKYLLIAFIAFFSASLVGQDGQHVISLNWQTGKSDNPYFTGANFHGDDRSIPYYIAEAPYVGYGTILKAEISNMVYETVILNETMTSDLPRDFTVRSWIENDRGQRRGFVEVATLRNNDGQVERLKSAVLSFHTEQDSKTALRGRGNKNESVLKDGVLYKLQIDQSGVYEISGQFIEEKLGLDIGDIDPGQIQIFGNPGGRLPEPNADPRPDDLEEIPTQGVGLEDGRLDATDRILFYAEEAGQWIKNGEMWVYETNIYDDHNYVFLKIGSEDRKEVTSVSMVSVNSYRTSYFDRQYYGKDVLNLLGRSISHQGSGKKWLSDEISNTRTIDLSGAFNTKDHVPGTEVFVLSHFYGRYEHTSEYVLTVGDQQFKKIISSTDYDVESTYAKLGVIRESFVTLSPLEQIRIDYTQTSAPSDGWVDFVNLNIRSYIQPSGSQFFIRDTFSEVNGGFSFETGANWKVWDVSDPNNIVDIATEYDGSTLRFSRGNIHEREFCVFQPEASLLIPEVVGPLSNQNLHAIDDVDMLIVTHDLFRQEAERLSAHRGDQDDLNIAVIDIETIYNEFSSGRQDPTALRDFCRMVYDRNPEFRYLLLFGDGSYDWRHTVKTHEDQNFVPVYETEESFAPIYAYPTDDYYALLSEDEGGNNLRGALDIATGRLVCRTTEEARVMVDKIIRYETDPQVYGDWRNKLIYLADDEDGNLHINQIEDVATTIASRYPVYNLDKIYFDAYDQISTPGGTRYPDAKASINQAVFKGGLVMVYLGHGGPTGLAQERVLQATDIRAWTNKYKMPVIMTATCSFTAFDEPRITSAGEYTVLNDQGGAIAILSTVRAVYAGDNKILTDAAHDFLYVKDSDGRALPLGEVMRRAKNKSSSGDPSNNRKFSLFGDPSMRLAIPRYDIGTIAINDVPADEFRDTLGALEKVTVKGAILNDDGNILTTFNGLVTPTVYDKILTLKTKGQDSRSHVKEFDLRKNVIFKGSASVTNGEFEFTFVVPKDINYDIGLGKISYYATDGIATDANGLFETIEIGGVGGGGIVDDEGPNVEVYMNNEDFAFGGITNPDPILFLKLSDDNGINVVGNSIGHDLVAILDDNSQGAFILNDFYTATTDDFTSGTVHYPLIDLAEGRHNIKVTVWDIANNFTEGYTEFVVVKDLKTGLKHVLNYPNPFSTTTKFQFEHNLPPGPIDIYIDIISVSGQPVKSIRHSSFSDGFRVDDIIWDGTSNSGATIPKGVYLYKIKVKADVSGTNISKESEFERLVILK